MFPTLAQSTSNAEAGGAPAHLEPVLLVDDDEYSIKECAFTLRALGYEPLIARDADEALEQFLSRSVSLAIVDARMAGRDDASLSEELARTAETQRRKLHFIVVTSSGAESVDIDAMHTSGACLLEKPVQPVDLRNALHRIDQLNQTPLPRQAVLDSLAKLRFELKRLSRLVDDPQLEAPGAADHAMRAPGSGRIEGGETAGGVGLDPPAPALADHIRELLKKEARRRSIGGGEVFGDPAWEMLLDLMLAKIEGRQVSVSSACIASGAPMSTALRLVGRLVAEGVLGKFPDRTDRRRHFLVINPRFEQPLLAYLTEQLQKPGELS